MAAAFTIAPLSVAHAAAASGLTTAVGWSHRREDWLLALSVGRGLGAFDAEGALRGTLVWFAYGPTHGSVGMIAVDPSLQGRGIGRALMHRALAESGDRSLVLVSTEAGRRLYETLGFREVGANAAHMGVGADAGPTDGVERARPDDLPAVQALDAAALGCARDALIAALAAAGDTAVVRDTDRIEGFAICRRFGAGYVVGPVVAPSTDIARRLIAFWLTRHADDMVRIDIPDEHAALAAWVIARGLPRGGESPIMVRGELPVPVIPIRRYALVSQAMG